MSANPVLLTPAREQQARTRAWLLVIAMLVLWAVYTVIEALFQTNRMHPVTVTILEFVPGLFGVGLLLAAGLACEDCFLKYASLSRQGLTVILLSTPLFLPVLLSGTWIGWQPVNALVLNPLGAISQELFFRCALLPALLLLLPGRPALAIGLHTLLFGLWHTGPLVTGAPIYGIVVVMLIPALLGLVWGWQTRYDGTVIWAMVYHVLLQFISAFYTWGG